MFESPVGSVERFRASDGNSLEGSRTVFLLLMFGLIIYFSKLILLFNSPAS